MMRRALYIAVVSGLLGGCASLDMQGVDPREFYAKNPIKNKVVSKTEAHVVTFEPRAFKLATPEAESLRRAVNQRSMLSTEAVVIEMPKADLRRDDRKQHLEKMLKMMGYHDGNVRYKADDKLPRNKARINFTYAEVVLPDCPDWRKSPNHNYSNTKHANFGCASEVNLGLMVADPRDLVRGTGELPPALSERGDKVLRNYHSNTPPGAASSGTPTGGNPLGSDTTNIAPVGVGE